MSLARIEKSAVIAGIAYIAMAVLHIPDALFKHAFDKDTPVQFFSLTTIATGFTLFIFLKSERFRFSRLPVILFGALLASQLISLFQSGDVIASFFGDSGRFVGTASTLALLVVAIFHTQFKLSSFFTLLCFYVAAVEAVTIIGLAQHFGLVELPGDQGMSSTLGNSDFFAAFVATSYPLLFLIALRFTWPVRILIGEVALLNTYALYEAGPLQAYVDMAIVAAGLSLFALKRFIPRPGWSLNIRTFLAGFAILIWAEVIFLMPFLGNMIPVLGNDPQVKIRSNFWLAGTRQFTDHLLFGVGPDQYGNYYEQYRTLDDVIRFPNILSNDAHSASVQTLATLGLFGALTFLALITLVARSLFILWDSQKISRNYTFTFGLYIFVHLTNSFISPITLTHKFIFWAICGFIVGQAYRRPSRKLNKDIRIQSGAIFAAAVLATTTGVNAYAQGNYLVSIEKFASDNSAVSTYNSPFILPCFAYFDAELLMVHTQGEQAGINFAQEKLSKSPRCTAAAISLGRIAANTDNLPALKFYLQQLRLIAPYRADTLSLTMYFANRTGDESLRKSTEATMKSLGLIYIPGKLG